MKKLFILTIALVLLAAAAGAGTLAYFSDTETSQENTFTSGTFDIALSNSNVFGSDDSVTATWVSPSNWAPGEKVNATLHFKNDGTIPASHIYFKFFNLTHDGKGDGSNLMDAILVTNIQERFNDVTTGNQVANIAAAVGDHHTPLTLAEFAGFANNWFGYYTVDDKSGDGKVLGGNGAADYDLILEFTFNPDAGNEYQGDTCSFGMEVNATQNSPTEGLVKLHE